jgi:hypothetical protein
MLELEQAIDAIEDALCATRLASPLRDPLCTSDSGSAPCPA